jgi:glycosyltransferase involved in cell wall biosynthesis
MNTLISIIIPTFNRAHLIGETLDSVLAQTYSNWECIVVDDGSADETEALINTYIALDSRFQYCKRPDKHLPGGNGARNYGFELSKGNYIQWFDSDDIMMPQKLELCVFEIESKNKDLVVSNFDILNRQAKKRKLDFDDLLKFHIADGTINTPMCFFRKEILTGFAFDETLVRSQEFEFFTRLFGSKSISFTIIEESLNEIRSHTDSITGKFEKGDELAIASMLYAKLSAINFSANLDNNTKEIVKENFEKALWKSLIFRHKKLYWKYLKLYTYQNKNIGIYKKIKMNVLAFLFFKFNRGDQVIRKYFVQ